MDSDRVCPLGRSPRVRGNLCVFYASCEYNATEGDPRACGGGLATLTLLNGRKSPACAGSISLRVIGHSRKSPACTGKRNAAQHCKRQTRQIPARAGKMQPGIREMVNRRPRLIPACAGRQRIRQSAGHNGGCPRVRGTNAWSGQISARQRVVGTRPRRKYHPGEPSVCGKECPTNTRCKADPCACRESAMDATMHQPGHGGSPRMRCNR